MDILKSKLRAFVVAFFFLFICSPMAMADNVNIGDLYYAFNEADNTAAVYGGALTGADVVIPESVSYEGKSYAVTSIGSYAFYWNDVLSSVKIPSSVTAIGQSAFAGCRNLASVNIPSSVTTIGQWLLPVVPASPRSRYRRVLRLLALPHSGVAVWSLQSSSLVQRPYPMASLRNAKVSFLWRYRRQ